MPNLDGWRTEIRDIDLTEFEAEQNNPERLDESPSGTS
jgi:hypothetical protein